ncbi:hypothetical protein EKO04_010492 [Ascochyta lentis]|uniref:Ankyrin repeat protein n=1 Tax=Ascochyta lentis TaxID=205686 RepID=A0A8H7ISV6_9PLEO|nr:hypothetical protein EKO04_010492 [Ascochyta lentis]
MEVAASIIAVLQISGKVTTFIQTASGAKTDRQRLRDAIRACEDILQELKDNADTSEAGKAWVERMQVLNQPGGILDRLRTALSLVQTKLQSDSIGKISKWPFQEKETMKLIEAIEREKSLLHLALSNHAGRLLHEINTRSQGNTEQLVELARMLDLNTDLSRDTLLNLNELKLSQSELKSSQAKLDSGMEALQKCDDALKEKQKRQEILDWLSKADHISSYHDAIHRRHAATGTWFLDSDEYRLWLATKGRTLFCPGMPGAGKTILASVVISDLNERYKSEPLYGVVFLFNVFNEKQSSKELLASLLQQLAERHEHLPVPVRELYKRRDDGRKPLLLQNITESLHAVASSLQRVFVVIDALDECNINSVRDFLTAIFALRDGCNINILATSRNIPDIASQFQAADVLEIRARDEDIQQFVRGTSHRLSKIAQNDPKLLDETAVKIAQSAQGMFLLAQLHVDSLAFKKSKKAFRDALTELASGSAAYDDAYEAAMTRTNGQTKEQAQFARDVLTWVVCARSPLTSLELCEALAVEDGVFDLDPENRPCLEDILSVCAGLIVTDEGSNKIRLVHYTTRKYFDRTKERWFPNAELAIAKTCITYLSLPDPEQYHRSHWVVSMNQGMNRRDDGGYDRLLQNYAARHWAVHASCTDISQVQGAILNFLSQPALVRFALEELHGRVVSEATGLHLAVRFGLENIVVKLLELGFDANAVAKYGTYSHHMDLPSCPEHSALTIAAEYGYGSIVKLLLSVDARVDTQFTSPHSWSPIQTATINGHGDIVKLLLAGSTMRDLKLSLSWAIRVNSVSLCEILLERAPVEPDDHFTPLHDTASKGLTDIVVLLLKNRFPKDAKDTDGQTPLFHAALQGHAHVVRQLLIADVTVDVADRRNQTPLDAAIESGHAEVVKLLLDAGANVGHQHVQGRTMLHTALSRCQANMVELLLNAGARVDIQDAAGRFPLHIAAIEGLVSSFECILSMSRGNDVSLRDSAGCTPLHLAAATGNLKIVECILSKGVNVDLQDDAGRTALWHACKDRNKSVASKLLSFGANWQIADHAGLDCNAATGFKETWGPFQRFENHRAILDLMRKRREGTAPDASERHSCVHTDEDIDLESASAQALK